MSVHCLQPQLLSQCWDNYIFMTHEHLKWHLNSYHFTFCHAPHNSWWDAHQQHYTDVQFLVLRISLIFRDHISCVLNDRHLLWYHINIIFLRIFFFFLPADRVYTFDLESASAFGVTLTFSCCNRVSWAGHESYTCACPVAKSVQTYHVTARISAHTYNIIPATAIYMIFTYRTFELAGFLQYCLRFPQNPFLLCHLVYVPALHPFKCWLQPLALH